MRVGTAGFRSRVTACCWIELSVGFAGDGASCGAEEGLEADVIWLATGKSSRLGVRGETDSAPGLLDAVLARYPAPVVGGYALLERPAARWPGPLPLFCVGRSAALVSGPAADQMPGLREVAQQVADYLSAHWPNLPPAEAAAPQGGQAHAWSATTWERTSPHLLPPPQGEPSCPLTAAQLGTHPNAGITGMWGGTWMCTALFPGKPGQPSCGPAAQTRPRVD